MNDDTHQAGVHIHIGGLLIILILALVLLKVDLKKTISSPQFQSNISYIEKEGKKVWGNYLAKPIMYVWNTVFTDILKSSLNVFKSGENTLFSPPQVQPYANDVKNEPVDQIAEPVRR